jgi:hypothetical protein
MPHPDRPVALAVLVGSVALTLKVLQERDGRVIHPTKRLVLVVLHGIKNNRHHRKKRASPSYQGFTHDTLLSFLLVYYTSSKWGPSKKLLKSPPQRMLVF